MSEHDSGDDRHERQVEKDLTAERDSLKAECQKRGEERAAIRKEKEELFRQSILTVKSWKDKCDAIEAECKRLREEKAAVEKMAIDSLILAQELINMLVKTAGIDNHPIVAEALADVNEKINKARASFEEKK
jgi:hypothetical protein